MKIPEWLSGAFMSCSDMVMRLLPYATPSQAQLDNTKIIAHRGIFNNRNILENTLPAFQQCLEHHIWGGECDIQWTKDGEPVLSHDPDLARLFSQSQRIDNLTLLELKQIAPQIPSLVEVVTQFGKQLHLMIELKRIAKDKQQAYMATLIECLKPLTPAKDYHLMSFDFDVLSHCQDLPSQALLPIADINAKQLVPLILEQGYAGIAGHYLLLSKRTIQQCLQHKLKVGTGQIDSPACLKREINRGVEWIFTNQALIIQDYCQQLHQPK